MTVSQNVLVCDNDYVLVCVQLAYQYTTKPMYYMCQRLPREPELIVCEKDYIYIYIYTYIHVYMYLYMHAYMHAYKHTYA